MGCIMTPMPNYLSTYLTTHLLMSGACGEHHSKKQKTTQNSVEIRKRAVWRDERCGNGEDEWMMRLRRERKIDGLYRNATK